MRHILICGDVGVGKSTLIEKLLRENRRPLCGFITKRVDTEGSELHEVYIHPVNGEWLHTQENLVGTIDALGAHPNPQAFDAYGTLMLNTVRGGLVVMDELGFLESQAFVFCKKVLCTLDGDIPVLAAIKSKDTPFLRAVKAHPRVNLHQITPDNRDELFASLVTQIKTWNQRIPE